MKSFDRLARGGFGAPRAKPGDTNPRLGKNRVSGSFGDNDDNDNNNNNNNNNNETLLK